MLQIGGSFKARGACNRVFAADADAARARRGDRLGRQPRPRRRLRGHAPRRAGDDLPARARAAVDRAAPRASSARASSGTGATGTTPGPSPRSTRATPARSWCIRSRIPRSSPGRAPSALELIEQLGRFDTVVVAIGGGGLIGGIALALKSLAPSVRVVGVEPTGATAMKDSLAAGKLVSLPRVDTIAGTLAPRNVGPHTLALAARFVDDVVLVSDAEMKAAMKRLWGDAARARRAGGRGRGRRRRRRARRRRRQARRRPGVRRQPRHRARRRGARVSMPAGMSPPPDDATVARRVVMFPLVRILLATAPIVLFLIGASIMASKISSHSLTAAVVPVALGIIVVLIYAGFVRLVERRAVAELGRAGAVAEAARGFAVGAALFTVTMAILILLQASRASDAATA